MSGGIFDSTIEKWIVRQYEGVDSESGLRLYGVVEKGDNFLFLTPPDGKDVFYYEIHDGKFQSTNLLSVTGDDDDDGFGVEVILDDSVTEYEYLSPPPK